MSSKRQIIKAMAVIRRPRDRALLVSESDSGSEPLFQRPLGGHVEFGEYAADTIHREFLEEIGQAVTDVRLLGVLENIFGWRGGTEHEVVFIFAAAFASDAAYEIEEQLIRDDTEPRDRVLWRAADAISPPLYPTGLSELIASSLKLARARMTTPQQFLITAESRILADADIKEHERPAEEDHAAHAPGRTCKACGQVIEPRHAARRRGESDWAHDVCPRQHADQPEHAALAEPGGRSG
jgi:ADP-ribose pyrophosphatase YjhB (NUDIX family)